MTYRKSDNTNRPIRKRRINTHFEKLFTTNRIMKDTEIKIQLDLGHLSIKQKATPIPYQLQNYVEK